MQGNRSAFTPTCDSFLHEENTSAYVQHESSSLQSPRLKNKMGMAAEKSRSSRTEVGKLQKRRRDRGINKGKYFQVGSINNNNQSSSRRSVFSNLLCPHHSKASEVKTASTPLLGNQVTAYFSSQHHYYIKQQLWEQFPFLKVKTLQESSP